jgi:chemotaxis protein CheD
MTPISVRMGEIAVARDGATLGIYGLGSCIGLSVWDPKVGVAAMAHFMLPSGSAPEPPAKFVDSGLDRLVAAFEASGGSVRRAQLKAAGGAAVLTLTNGLSDIGRRNADALEASLANRGLRLTASDLGGTMARTIELSPSTGCLSVRAATTTRTL